MTLPPGAGVGGRPPPPWLCGVPPCSNRVMFLSFPYACPERVLVQWSFVYKTWTTKPFSHREETELRAILALDITGCHVHSPSIDRRSVRRKRLIVAPVKPRRALSEDELSAEVDTERHKRRAAIPRGWVRCIVEHLPGRRETNVDLRRQTRAELMGKAAHTYGPGTAGARCFPCKCRMKSGALVWQDPNIGACMVL
jgi:hypothetical protein